MATAESVKAKINNLIAKANAATGKSDTDLTSGINSLIDGFGKSETVEIFDGTINIESGFTTISGSYRIDQKKAYDLLQTYGKVKTFNVKFSAGGSGSGMGDSIDFTSMTFDGTYGFIKYNDKAAFAMNGGFAEYNANYGDGNGARVNFEEGTECRKEFKELFLSIADEYVEANVVKISLEVNSSDEGIFNFPVPSGVTTWSGMNGVVDETSQYVITTTIATSNADVPKICRAGAIVDYFYGLVKNNVNTNLVRITDTLDYDNTYYSFVNSQGDSGGGSN